MPDVYIHLNGQQMGPYPLAQIQQMLAAGQITAETPAWCAGVTNWTTVGGILSLKTGGSPPPPPAAKKGMSGCMIAAIIVGSLCVLLVPCCAGIALGPITKGIEKAKESASLQTSRTIALAMFEYANDHNGAYPDGKTSTEVFQKLIDGKYISDPGLFYIPGMPGKVRATSNQLTAANVCFDCTSGVTTSSPDGLPVVFSTGYTIQYSAGASAQATPVLHPFPGLAVAYKDNSARFLTEGPVGTVQHVVPATFDPGSASYIQLTP